MLDQLLITFGVIIAAGLVAGIIYMMIKNSKMTEEPKEATMTIEVTPKETKRAVKEEISDPAVKVLKKDKKIPYVGNVQIPKPISEPRKSPITVGYLLLTFGITSLSVWIAVLLMAKSGLAEMAFGVESIALMITTLNALIAVIRSK